MTPEQKDWFEYATAKYFYYAMKALREPNYRELARKAWDARKKAHRWNVKHTCENCKHYDKADFAGCYACNSGANWEPID